MKTVQIYFSPRCTTATRLGYDQQWIFTKDDKPIGLIRGVLISDCDVSHAIARAKPRTGEVFVGAVAIE